MGMNMVICMNRKNTKESCHKRNAVSIFLGRADGKEIIMNTISLLSMLQSQDSLFPIGAFTLSNGLETLVQEMVITNSENLQEYVKSYLSMMPYNELGVAALAYQHSEDVTFIQELDEYYGALRVPMEVRQGSEKLCRRFLKLLEHIKKWKTGSLKIYYEKICKKECYGHHPIAVGLYAKERGVPLDEGLTVYGYNILSAIVTNTVKSVPLSQMEGQRILFEAFTDLEKAVLQAQTVNLMDVGIGGTEFEIAAMRHETLYSRLYMS